MRPAVVFGIVTGDALVSYWPVFSLTSVTVPESFAKVNSVQFFSIKVSQGAHLRQVRNSPFSHGP